MEQSQCGEGYLEGRASGARMVVPDPSPQIPSASGFVGRSPSEIQSRFKLTARTSARRSGILRSVKYDIGGGLSMKIVVIGGSGLIG